MALHPLAGQKAPRSVLVDVPRLVSAYYTLAPDPSDPGAARRVRHLRPPRLVAAQDASTRPTSWRRARRSSSTAGRRASTARSSSAWTRTRSRSRRSSTALEVFAANGVEVRIQAGRRYTPTPAISHAILDLEPRPRRGRSPTASWSRRRTTRPDDGGFKYNPPDGGPAGTEITKAIEARANAILEAGLATCGASRSSGRCARRRRASTTSSKPYVDDLANVVDMDAIAGAKLQIGVDPLGGASIDYWEPIAERYGLELEVVNPVVDPTFSFMTLDRDGKIRMDCSSPYAMAGLIGLKDRFDVAFGNDADSDRHGIVTPSAGLLNPNHYLAVAISYLFAHRPGWRADAAVGKTLVSSSMIDRVARDLGRRLVEVPVGFKWFVDGLVDGSLGFGGEESAGASFLRSDGTVWTTDKDGILLDLLAGEIRAVTGRDPGELYRELEGRFGEPGLRADRRAGDARAEGGARQALAGDGDGRRRSPASRSSRSSRARPATTRRSAGSR